MKKLIRLLFALVSLMLLFAASGHAEHYRGWGPGWGPLVGVGVGVGLWELSRPHYYYPGYYPDYYYSSPPVVIQQASPDVYIRQAPQPAPAQPQEPAYWYYCEDSQGYYPYVKQCSKGWMKVVPTPPAPK